jgi:ABC-2 type transport system ATP-binding protein
MTFLDIRNIRKSFPRGDGAVLEDVNLSVNSGEIFGLVGLNGVGKTTLIKIILDLMDSDSGECLICGKSNRDPNSRDNIFYLPEKFQPSQNLRVIEFFRIFIEMNGTTLPKLENICEKISLGKSVLNEKIGNLSKGMVQKIGLAASIIENKKLVILDEPMSGLDPKARIYLKNALLEYKKDGNSVFFSSHILSDIDEICDIIAVLHNSTIKFVGAPNEFKKNHDETSLERAFLREIGLFPG